jgi:hypothetical protein
MSLPLPFDAWLEAIEKPLIPLGGSALWQEWVDSVHEVTLASQVNEDGHPVLAAFLAATSVRVMAHSVPGKGDVWTDGRDIFVGQLTLERKLQKGMDFLELSSWMTEQVLQCGREALTGQSGLPPGDVVSFIERNGLRGRLDALAGTSAQLDLPEKGVLSLLRLEESWLTGHDLDFPEVMALMEVFREAGEIIAGHLPGSGEEATTKARESLSGFVGRSGTDETMNWEARLRLISAFEEGVRNFIPEETSSGWATSLPAQAASMGLLFFLVTEKKESLVTGALNAVLRITAAGDALEDAAPTLEALNVQFRGMGVLVMQSRFDRIRMFGNEAFTPVFLAAIQDLKGNRSLTEEEKQRLVTVLFDGGDDIMEKPGKFLAEFGVTPDSRWKPDEKKEDVDDVLTLAFEGMVEWGKNKDALCARAVIDSLDDFGIEWKNRIPELVNMVGGWNFSSKAVYAQVVDRVVHHCPAIREEVVGFVEVLSQLDFEGQDIDFEDRMLVLMEAGCLSLESFPDSVQQSAIDKLQSHSEAGGWVAREQKRRVSGVASDSAISTPVLRNRM